MLFFILVSENKIEENFLTLVKSMYVCTRADTHTHTYTHTLQLKLMKSWMLCPFVQEQGKDVFGHNCIIEYVDDKLVCILKH